MTGLQLACTQAGVRPLCQHCGDESDHLELVTPRIAAGHLRLYRCPRCRRNMFRPTA